MIPYTWYPHQRPGRVEVRNVSVFAFDAAGRIVLWHHDHRFGLPGGHIEPADRGCWETTGRRETWEEITAELAEVRYLGYQTVTGPGCEVFAQARLVAKLGAVHPARPDPDGGARRRRIAVAPGRGLFLLGWADDRARAQFADAATAAYRWWGVRATDSTPDAPITPTVTPHLSGLGGRTE